MKVKIIQYLNDAVDRPTKKFCFYTGQNDPKVADELGIEQWDWTPQRTVNIEPYYWNTHTVALAFGCQPKFTSEGKEWIAPLITKPTQVHDIAVPDLYSGRTGEILNLVRKMMREFPEETLIRLPDIQSPLGVCELMWDQSFYIALISNPDEINILLDKVTSFIINYVNEFKAILGHRYNPACHPQLWSDPVGYYISDDANSMVSPEMHYRLCVEYINKITAECGPVFYHSCTFTDPYIENIKKVNNKKAINWSTGTSMDPAKIMKIFSGQVLLAPHLGKGIHEEAGVIKLGMDFQDEVDVFKYFVDSMGDNTTMNIVIHESLLDDIDTMKRIYRLFQEYGFTPQQVLKNE